MRSHSKATRILHSTIDVSYRFSIDRLSTGCFSEEYTICREINKTKKNRQNTVHIQGAEVVLVPPLLHSYEVEGAPMLFPHPPCTVVIRAIKFITFFSIFRQCNGGIYLLFNNSLFV